MFVRAISNAIEFAVSAVVDPESDEYARSLNAMFAMKKLDIEELHRAYDG